MSIQVAVVIKMAHVALGKIPVVVVMLIPVAVLGEIRVVKDIKKHLAAVGDLIIVIIINGVFVMDILEIVYPIISVV
jgi:hypothetical protein